MTNLSKDVPFLALAMISTAFKEHGGENFLVCYGVPDRKVYRKIYRLARSTLLKDRNSVLNTRSQSTKRHSLLMLFRDRLGTIGQSRFFLCRFNSIETTLRCVRC